MFQNTVELDAFDRIELDVSYVEDVALVPSDRYAVEYRTWGSSEEPVCRVEDGRLLFREGPFSGSDSRIWFLYADPGSEYTRELEGERCSGLKWRDHR